MPTKRLKTFALVIVAGALAAACARPTVPGGPRFSGRLLFLTGENANGADLVELSAESASSTYNQSVVTRGVFEAKPSPDRTRLLYTTKDEILLRDLRNGDVKSLVKGEDFCLAWSPDGSRFSYKQKSPEQQNGPGSKADARTRLYVSDLDGKTRMVWEDLFAASGASGPQGQTTVVERTADPSGCPHWIAPDRLIFDRFLGAIPKQNSELLKPNTTTVATLADSVKLSDTERKWSIESICQAGSAVLLRPPDQAQPILIARSLEPLKTLNPSPLSCSNCRFVGFAANSCVPFFIEDDTSTSTELFYLNPTNWQRQRGTRIDRVFSANAKMLIKSSARLMIVGDIPASLLLIDTETGDIVPLLPKSAEAATSEERLISPVPVVWIEN